VAIRKTRNKFETKIERQLKKAKVSFKYESERIPYLLSGHYIPDFVVSLPNGKIYIETKGYLRPEHKRKMVAVKKLNPHLDIRILFYSKKTKDIRWAEKYGFIYAIEDIPKEWLIT
jgi:predicted nuclease of restriction endonuclease-like RecB superfamily